jgi:hypothetical protein
LLAFIFTREGTLLTKRNSKDDGFNTSVSDLIAQFRDIKDRFLHHPAIPYPWPSWVPSPEYLDWKLNQLEEVYRELDPNDMAGFRRLHKIRRELKTSMVRLLRYVEQTLTGSHNLLPPGFDLARNPGCPAEGAAYGSGLARSDLRPHQEGATAKSRMAGSELRKYLVRAVRPLFQAACIEVEARDRGEAIDHALSSAADIPESMWTGRNDPDDYFFAVNCVRTGQTDEGFPISLLDFPRYTVVSTNPNPPVEAYAVWDPWMDKAPPILAASLLSIWTDQLLSSQGLIYEDALDEIEEIKEQWKGSDDEKVLPLKDPEERRFLMNMTEELIKSINMLREPEDE